MKKKDVKFKANLLNLEKEGLENNLKNESDISYMILIPAFNVGTRIESTLSDIVDFFENKKKIVVIDDGSSDNTPDIVKKFGVVLLQHKTNLGKGAALKSGFKFAMSQNIEWALVLDADGQHNPAFIPKFVQTAEKSKNDLILGRRDLSTKLMPFDRYLSNQLTSIIISFCCRTRIRDSQCGYRMIKLDKMNRANLITNHFETESELLIRYSRLGAKIKQIPVSTVYIDKSSSIRRIIDFIRFLKMLLITMIFW